MILAAGLLLLAALLTCALSATAARPDRVSIWPDRRCAEGVGTGHGVYKEGAVVTAVPTPSADRRLAESPERQRAVRRAQPGGPK